MVIFVHLRNQFECSQRIRMYWSCSKTKVQKNGKGYNEIKKSLLGQRKFKIEQQEQLLN